MRDPDRIARLLDKIGQRWMEQPDTRLIQLLMNALEIYHDPYYVEDDELERALDESKI